MKTIPTSDAIALFNAIAKFEMLQDMIRTPVAVQKAWREVSDVMDGIRENTQ